MARRAAQIAVLVVLALRVSAQVQQETKVRVLLFLRSDCPISQRYAPELQRIAQEFKGKPVEFWQVYSDPSESEKNIQKTIDDYHFPGKVVRDPKHELVKRAHAETTPEAAVFDVGGRLEYHGRIDDRYVDIGKTRPEATVHDLEDAISAVLAHRPVKEPVTKAVGCSLADLNASGTR